MGDPNLDLGLEYTGGIAKPTTDQVGAYGRVALDAQGDPNLEYVNGIERRIAFAVSGATGGLPGILTGTLVKTSLGQPVTIPANTMIDGRTRLRVMIYGEAPARAGTLIGVDTVTSGVPSQLNQLSVTGVPIAASAFFYELIMFPSTPTTQRVMARLTCDQVAVKTATSTTAVDMTVDQRIDVTAQLANVADSITFRRIEVWQLT